VPVGCELSAWVDRVCTRFSARLAANADPSALVWHGRSRIDRFMMTRADAFIIRCRGWIIDQLARAVRAYIAMSPEIHCGLWLLIFTWQSMLRRRSFGITNTISDTYVLEEPIRPLQLLWQAAEGFFNPNLNRLGQNSEYEWETTVKYYTKNRWNHPQGFPQKAQTCVFWTG